MAWSNNSDQYNPYTKNSFINYDYFISYANYEADIKNGEHNEKRLQDLGERYFSDPAKKGQNKSEFESLMTKYKEAEKKAKQIKESLIEPMKVLRGINGYGPEYKAQKEKVIEKMSKLYQATGEYYPFWGGKPVSLVKYISDLITQIERSIGIFRDEATIAPSSSVSGYHDGMVASWPEEEEKKNLGFQSMNGAVAPNSPRPGSGSGSGSDFRFQSMNGAVAPNSPRPGSGSGSGFRYQSMNGVRIEGGRTRRSRSRKHTRKSKGKKASRGRR